MTEKQIAESYAPFIATLRDSEFDTPAEGWTAELIAVHIVVNNDAIADVAERITTGEAPGYDNATAVDEVALGLLADELGSLQGLADAVERSATRLGVAQGKLNHKRVRSRWTSSFIAMARLWWIGA
jgi:hypothetical protein